MPKVAASTFYYVIYRLGESVPRRLVVLDSNTDSIAQHLDPGDLFITVPKASIAPGTSTDLALLQTAAQPIPIPIPPIGL